MNFKKYTAIIGLMLGFAGMQGMDNEKKLSLPESWQWNGADCQGVLLGETILHLSPSVLETCCLKTFWQEKAGMIYDLYENVGAGKMSFELYVEQVKQLYADQCKKYRDAFYDAQKKHVLASYSPKCDCDFTLRRGCSDCVPSRYYKIDVYKGVVNVYKRIWDSTHHTCKTLPDDFFKAIGYFYSEHYRVAHDHEGLIAFKQYLVDGYDGRDAFLNATREIASNDSQANEQQGFSKLYCQGSEHEKKALEKPKLSADEIKKQAFEMISRSPIENAESYETFFKSEETDEHRLLFAKDFLAEYISRLNNSQLIFINKKHLFFVDANFIETLNFALLSEEFKSGKDVRSLCDRFVVDSANDLEDRRMRIFGDEADSSVKIQQKDFLLSNLKEYRTLMNSNEPEQVYEIMKEKYWKEMGKCARENILLQKDNEQASGGTDFSDFSTKGAQVFNIEKKKVKKLTQEKV